MMNNEELQAMTAANAEIPTETSATKSRKKTGKAGPKKNCRGAEQIEESPLQEKQEEQLGEEVTDPEDLDLVSGPDDEELARAAKEAEDAIETTVDDLSDSIDDFAETATGDSDDSYADSSYGTNASGDFDPDGAPDLEGAFQDTSEKILNQAVNSLAALGKKNGYVTHHDMEKQIPAECWVEEMLDQISLALEERGITIVSDSAQASNPAAEKSGGDDDMPLYEAELGRMEDIPLTDPVRMYLRDIGKYALLTSSEEKELAIAVKEPEAIQERLCIKEALRQRLSNHEPVGFSKSKRNSVRGLFGMSGDFPQDASKDLSEEEIAKILAYDPSSDAIAQAEAEAKRAREKIINANLRLVVSIAKKYTRRGMQFSDLVQVGNMGLMKAVEKFDHTRGYKFSTYATWWIRQAITRAIADQARTIRIPVHMVETMNRMTRISRQLVQELGREPTDQEIAAKMGIEPERVEEIRLMAQPIDSLNRTIGEDQDTDISDFIEDVNSPSPEEATADTMLHEQLEEALGALSEREREVLRYRFGLKDGRSYTLEEVGKEFGVTRERIRQIEAKALRKLRHPSRSRKLRDFLS